MLLGANSYTDPKILYYMGFQTLINTNRSLEVAQAFAKDRCLEGNQLFLEPHTL